MGRIAMKTGNHFVGFHGLVTRIPMRKTTKSPSMSAAYLPGYVFAISFPLDRLTLTIFPRQDIYDLIDE